MFSSSVLAQGKVVFLINFIQDSSKRLGVEDPSKRLGVEPQTKRSLRYTTPTNIPSKRLGVQQVGEALLEIRRTPKLKTTPGSEELVTKADKLVDESQTDKAIEIYRKVIDSNSKTSSAYFGLATALIKLEKFDEAIEQINIGLKLSPDDIEGQVNLGVAFYRSGRIDESVAHYKNLLNSTKTKNAEDIASIYYNLGVAYSHQEKFDEAISNYENAIKQQKNYSEAYNNLGLIYEAKGDGTKAKECFFAAIKSKNIYPLAHYNLSRQYNPYDKDEYSKVIDELLIAIKQNPNFAEAYLDLGNRYLLKKALDTQSGEVPDVNDAIKVFQKALSLRKDTYPLAHENLAIALTLQKNFKEAYAHYRIALDQYQETSLNTLHNIVTTRKKVEDFSTRNDFYIGNELSRAEDESNLKKLSREKSIEYMKVELDKYEALDDELKDNFTLRYCAGYCYFSVGNWNASIDEFAEAWELSGKKDKDALNALIAVLELVKYY